jgi:hypothetical protein
MKRRRSPSGRFARRIVTVTSLCGVALSCWLAVASAASPTLDVCRQGCAYSQIAAAVAAAPAGSNLRVGPGTYTGGFTIDQNLTLVGAGASRTTISGGGPVITVGVSGAASEPTVAISGVTITGGDTTSSAVDATLGFTEPGILALGGGILVPPSVNAGVGATLTISDSVITHNTAAPSTAVDAGFSCGPSGDCQFAQAGGGGIDSWGDLTITDSSVTDNQSTGPETSDADGAGIYSQDGTLTLERSVVTGNRGIATIPNGRFAEGAGIMFDTTFGGSSCVSPAPACTFIVRDSVIDGNSSTVTSNLPSFGDGQLITIGANAGGIHVGNNITTTLQNSTIDDNSATATDPQGEAGSIDAAMIIGTGSLTMQNTSIERNRTITTALTTADEGPAGSTFEVDGTGAISDSDLDDNLVVTDTPNGVAGATGTLGIFSAGLVTVDNSEISGNTTLAQSKTGSANALGGGVINNSLLTMHHVVVTDNHAVADAPTGTAQGGGIWNSDALLGQPLQLTLEDSVVSTNGAQGSAGVVLSGGGLYTDQPVTLTNSIIRRNQPDDCDGCS